MSLWLGIIVVVVVESYVHSRYIWVKKIGDVSEVRALEGARSGTGGHAAAH